MSAALNGAAADRADAEAAMRAELDDARALAATWLPPEAVAGLKVGAGGKGGGRICAGGSRGGSVLLARMGWGQCCGKDGLAFSAGGKEGVGVQCWWQEGGGGASPGSKKGFRLGQAAYVHCIALKCGFASHISRLLDWTGGGG
eukprot:354084-Chlamydomonas_euryale.AAC.10